MSYCWALAMFSMNKFYCFSFYIRRYEPNLTDIMVSHVYIMPIELTLKFVISFSLHHKSFLKSEFDRVSDFTVWPIY